MIVKVLYYKDGEPMNQAIMGHSFSAVSDEYLVGQFRENAWHPDIIRELSVNGKILPPDRREKFYDWLNEITRKVDEENEKRKKADKESV
ncbi:hypothetical protein [Rossellomorea marisflavi]|uniref:hypothetical protein n=1 Tax=Rossellomorea marisflavi TaxID=189381 RepID=UPI003D2EB0F0